MSSELIPSNPVDVLVIRDLTPNIVTLSLPFLRKGKFEIGGRCTIVRLSAGGVLVFSPVALTPEATAVVKRLGGDHSVKYLVAPDIEHHIFLSEWAAAYPQARIIAPAGLPEKRTATGGTDPKIRVDDKFFAVLRDGTDPSVAPEPPIAADFDADFEVAYFDSHPNKEIVLLYRPDRVLIQADLLFNLPAIEQYSRVDQATRLGGTEHPDLYNRLFQGLMSTEGPAMAARRFQWYVISRNDRPRFNAGIRRVASWDFDTVIPCHGEVLQGDGKAVFEKIFAWHLAETQ